MASAAACIAPLCVASQSIRICQAVCHPLSGGSVACLVCASPHFTQADRALCAVIACQRIAVLCLAIHFHCTMKKECAMKVFQVHIAHEKPCQPILHLRNIKSEGLTLLQAALCAAVRRGCAATGKRDTRLIVRRSEAKCDRRPESARAPGCIRRRRDGDGRRRMVFHPKPDSPYRRADDAS